MYEVSAAFGWAMTTAGANGDWRTELLMRAARIPVRRLPVSLPRAGGAHGSPAGLGLPDAVCVPAAERSGVGVDTTWPVVPAISRLRSSTIAPRAPRRSTVRNACVCANFAYCFPCSTWIDHARRNRSESPAATTIASPPTRT